MNRKLVKLPSLDYLKECFILNPSEGKLFWKERPLHHFKGKYDHLNFNKKFAFKETGYVSNNGSVSTKLNNINYSTPRIIYSIFHNVELDNEIIEHKNGNSSDNRISNLKIKK